MKKKLMELFFKKELKYIYNFYQEEFNNVNNKLQDLESELNNLRRSNEIVENIFKQLKNVEIIGIEKNNIGDIVYVCKKQYSDLITILLYNENWNITKQPSIMVSIFWDNTMKIEDIDAGVNNVGNGSILMKYLLSTAKKMGILEIKGWLSPVDQDHFERSEHYYKKFGFNVDFNKDRTSGNISINFKKT